MNQAVPTASRIVGVSRDSAFICVFATLAANSNQPTASCSPVPVSRGSGTATVRFVLPATTALPVTTTSLWLLMGSTPQFPSPFLVSKWEAASFNWIR